MFNQRIAVRKTLLFFQVNNFYVDTGASADDNSTSYFNNSNSGVSEEARKNSEPSDARSGKCLVLSSRPLAHYNNQATPAKTLP